MLLVCRGWSHYLSMGGKHKPRSIWMECSSTYTYIDATKKFNISLMEKSLVHFSTVEGKPQACLRHVKE
ncbi:hypothetical protein D9546_11890 [Geobacillus stearothermophilus]|nr:hypothetical protein D9546_11890 [Geobacillus stearothermophilus]